MLHLAFHGHRPSRFRVNPIVRAFIISEAFFWSGWNLINPIFAVFVADQVCGGSVEAAGFAVTTYLISRIIFELITAKVLAEASDQKRFVFSLTGIILIGIVYFIFSFAETIGLVIGLQLLSGVGFGIASPAKYALFSEHLDKGKESTEWGIYDAITLSGMALTAMLGGFIAQNNGFSTLFRFSAIMIMLGAFPFILFVKSKQK